VTQTPLSRSKGQRYKLVTDVLNSQHAETGASWRINTKILSSYRGGGILWRPPAQLVTSAKAKDVVFCLCKYMFVIRIILKSCRRMLLKFLEGWDVSQVVVVVLSNVDV